MAERHSMAERSRLPAVLWDADVAVVLGLPSARAAREFLVNHGVAHARLGARIFITTETLVAFIRDHEERRQTKAEIRAKADAVVAEIAPTARQRRRGRRPPGADTE